MSSTYLIVKLHYKKLDEKRTLESFGSLFYLFIYLFIFTAKGIKQSSIKKTIIKIAYISLKW